jgi:hypothetical protein
MTWVLVIIIIALLVALAVVVMRQRRSKELKEGFGPEYQRVVEERGDQRSAESELAERRKRREQLDIRPLDPGDRDRYAEQWRATQKRFVDDPSGAVGEADELVIAVMRRRGYPVDDFDQRAADVSVDHPVVVENYRAAHDISTANADGRARTEDLRQAMVHYRALFDDLLGAGDERTREDEARNDIREVR